MFEQYYHNLLESYATTFGTLFNNIFIIRKDSNNNEIDRFKVPLSYSPKDKLLAKASNDKNDDRNVAIKLPRMFINQFLMIFSLNYQFCQKVNKMDLRL